MGPYNTQEEGWAAVMGLDGCPIEEATVWFGEDPALKGTDPKPQRLQRPPAKPPRRLPPPT